MPFSYRTRHLITRSRRREIGVELPNRLEIWQSSRQRCQARYYHKKSYLMLTRVPAFMGHYCILLAHDDVLKWKHFPRCWPSVRGIPRSPVNSPHKGHWREALMFSLICAWINGWVDNCEAGDLRHHGTHNDVTVMMSYPMLTRVPAFIGHSCILLAIVLKFFFWELETKATEIRRN